ncbi:hypothetical protein [Companilactobacillus jidongensis]|uniref:hypothetical protein n=1 Tax=Companilactobacillus jidongensis TaxID=2486006 RepID=UPI000F76951A|nr:hypothetical protein [Companilactobacillus jidongensis]
MKRKGILFTVIMALLLVLTGCTSQSKQSTKSSTPTVKTTKIEAKAYDSLSKSDRAKVKFTFKYYLDDTSAGVVSVEINNRTDKKISFDQSKFIFKGSHDVKASKKGNVTVSPNKEMTIKRLFTKVDSSFFEESGLLVYRNDNFKLAYVEQNTKVFSSDNLTNKTLISGYKEFFVHRAAWDKQKADYNKGIYGNDSSDSSSDTTDDNSESQNQTATQTSSDSKNVVNNEEEAEALVEKQNGSAGDVTETDPDIGAHYTSYSYDMVDTGSGERAYWVRIAIPMGDVSSYPFNWTVFPDGRVEQGNPSDN